MKVVAFLQNMWFKDPARMKVQLETSFKGDREKFIRTWLFFSCLTGKRLERVFGELIDEIVWEEVSRELGGFSASAFPPEPEHIEAVLAKHAPTHVIAFGRIAQNALCAIHKVDPQRFQLIFAPHPAARGEHILSGLHSTAGQIRDLFRESCAADEVPAC